MHMPSFGIDSQAQLIVAHLDDFTPNGALPNFEGGQYGQRHEIWRSAVVNFIYEMHRAGLIEPFPGIESYEQLSSEDIKNSLIYGDRVNNIDVELLWDSMHFSGTELLGEILRSCRLDSWDALASDLSMELKDRIDNL